MHANLVGTSGLRLDRFGVDVLEELKATVTVWRLEHRNVGVIAIKADGSVGPLTTDRVTADDRETEVCEKGDRCFEVANGDADVLKFDGHVLHATEPGRLAPMTALSHAQPFVTCPSPHPQRQLPPFGYRSGKRDACAIGSRAPMEHVRQVVPFLIGQRVPVRDQAPYP